jgi:hypothetical protein
MSVPSFKPGDIICADRLLYKHYGVYAGNNRVIHFAPKHGLEINPKDAFIQETSLDEFIKDSHSHVDNGVNPLYSPEETVRRARTQLSLGKGQYNLVFKNCEHFARWCKSGVAESHQVNTVAGVAVGVALTAAAVGIGIGIHNLLSDTDKKRDVD